MRDCIHATSNMSRLIMGDCNEHPDSQAFQVFKTEIKNIHKDVQLFSSAVDI